MHSSKQKLNEQIIQFFGARPHQPASALIEFLKKSSAQNSRSGIFKALRLLVSQKILVKEKTRYSVSLSWLLTSASKLERLLKQCIQSLALEHFLPAQGKSKRWRFNSFILLNEFWIQVALALFNNCPDPIMYEWNPHPWYTLLQPENEVRLRKAIGSLQKKEYIIIGGQSYLDRLVKSVHSDDIYNYSFSESPFHHLHDRHIGLIGDYVLTITLTSVTAKTLSNLYSGIKGPQDVKIAEVITFLTTPARLNLKVEHNVRKAKNLRKKFKEFWDM